MNNITKILIDFIDNCKPAINISCGITFSSPKYILNGVKSIEKYLNNKIDFNELLKKLEEVQNDLEEEYYFYETDDCDEGDFADV
jgi:hypothetical protein